MIRFPRPLLLPALSCCLVSCAAVPDFYEAQNLGAKPFNQLDLAGNACGPAAFLNSSRFGSEDWRKISENPPSLSDRERIRAIARGPAMRESSSLPGRARWSKRGINLSDLRDVANEIRRPYGLPPLSQATFFVKPEEDQGSHLARVHSAIASSLAEGFPPIVSLRRYVKRGGQWISVQGHFVTITSIPGRPPSEAAGFAVKYIDPWGGKFREGEIAMSEMAFMGSNPARNPNLEAVFPDVTVGKRFVRSGETSILVVAAALGHF